MKLEMKWLTNAICVFDCDTRLLRNAASRAHDVEAAAASHHHHASCRNLTLGVIDNVCKPIRGGKRRHPRILKKIMNSNQKKARTPRRKVSQHLIGLCIQTELQFHIE
jgi:hypothetical protein